MRLEYTQKLLENEFEQLEKQLLLLRGGRRGHVGGDGGSSVGRDRRRDSVASGNRRRGTATDVSAVRHLLT